jgi:hypothetical protein
VTRQATELSKRLKRPVKVIWPREEDMAQDKQRPPNVTRFTASLKGNGLPFAWTSRSVWFVPEGVDRVGPGHRRLRDQQHALPGSEPAARARSARSRTCLSRRTVRPAPISTAS